MKKHHKILLLLGTVMPVLLFITYLIVFFLNFRNVINFDSEIATTSVFYLYIILVVAMVLFQFVMLLIYSILIFRNINLKENEKLLWFLIILFGTSLGQLVYYIRHIHNSSSPIVSNFKKKPSEV